MERRGRNGTRVTVNAIPSAEDQDNGIHNEIQGTRLELKTLAPEVGVKRAVEERKNRDGEGECAQKSQGSMLRKRYIPAK
jgi:hypothetical protein